MKYNGSELDNKEIAGANYKIVMDLRLVWERERDRQTDREIETERQRQTERDRDRKTKTERDRDRDRQTDGCVCVCECVYLPVCLSVFVARKVNYRKSMPVCTCLFICK